MSGHREGGWAPTDACGQLQIVGVRVVGNRDFLPLCYPGVVAQVFRPSSPRMRTKVPGLTGTTPLSRKPAPARLCEFFIRLLRRGYFWILSEQMFCARKQPPKPGTDTVRVKHTHTEIVTRGNYCCRLAQQKRKRYCYGILSLNTRMLSLPRRRALAWACFL